MNQKIISYANSQFCLVHADGKLSVVRVLQKAGLFFVAEVLAPFQFQFRRQRFDAATGVFELFVF